MNKVLALAASLVATLAACATDPNGGGAGPDKNGGPDDPPGGDGSLTADAYLEQLVTRDCQKAFTCKAEYPPAEGTFDDDWGATEAECLATDVDYLERADVVAAIMAGTIDFDATAAAACLADAAYPATCAAFFTDYDWPDSCYDALEGKVADGGVCSTGWQCGPDSDCEAGKCTLIPEERRAPRLRASGSHAGWRR
jgi:hypothetical protein